MTNRLLVDKLGKIYRISGYLDEVRQTEKFSEVYGYVLENAQKSTGWLVDEPVFGSLTDKEEKALDSLRRTILSGERLEGLLQSVEKIFGNPLDDPEFGKL